MTAAEAQSSISRPGPSILTVDSVSQDQRRVHRDSVPLPRSTGGTPSGTGTPQEGFSTLQSPDAGDPLATVDWDAFLLPLEPTAEDPLDDAAAKSKAPRYQNSDQPMITWIPKRDLFLDELLRREGRGQFTADRCTSVQRWTGVSFEQTTLKDLGLVVQLGHRHNGTTCANPIPVRDNFSVIDINGRHVVMLAFCGCDGAGEAGDNVQQLLRFDLYPATDCEPNTAFTIALLEHYHLQSLQGKISMYDYYTTLERLTDNTGTKKVVDRYKEFMRVVAQWRHLKMLKRAGRAHCPEGIKGTGPGELAVRCPACPHPGINLPDNWQDVSDDLKYMYWLTVAVDACFRLKRRDVSSTQKDPFLGNGWGYFVEDTGYHEVLKGYQDQDEMSSCTGFSAIDHANNKFSKGYAATGVGAVVCARHEFWLALGMGDLQKGERYVNMDYIFVSAMREYLVVNKLVTYDIACQWSKNLLERIASFPAGIQIDIPEGSIMYAIPKLHFRSHIQEGHSPYSLNYRKGCARNDGEGIERRWWDIQPITGSTKMMGPGQRQGVLEDHLGYGNWRKFVELPWTLRDRLRDALKSYMKNVDHYTTLTVSLMDENVKLWTAQVNLWEADPWAPGMEDPYVVASSGLTEAETVQRLTEEEQKASAVKGYIALHDVSMLGFMKMGVDLEETKIALRRDAKQATPSKQLGLHERRNALRRKLLKYRELQGVYMPRAMSLIANDPACHNDVERVEDVRLVLPSEIALLQRGVVCSPRLCEMEERMREAQCRDALQDVRNQLHIIDHLFRYKKVNVRHQGANTRVRTDIASQDTKKTRAAEKYRRARRAKLALAGSGVWEQEFQVLEDRDIRPIVDDDPDEVALRKRKRGEKGAVAEGHRTISWIWQAADSSSPAAVIDLLRVEWLKARARKMRWEEEVRLLPEEMRRVLVTLQYEEKAWLARRTARVVADPALQEGLAAYATRQAAIRCAMRGTFVAVCRMTAIEANGSQGDEWEVASAMESVAGMDNRDFDSMYELDGEDLQERCNR
ncbi:hypothetical protein TRAPUB_10982 [Trametes pubescens]|uniref:CxC2-like cysteine cluster KDZ transposase-associated domain-containing protein n=1 Tax=Trametes pubescens TaxID=154538 RepID=A0A1M2VXY3_TRAPU|nr:hypothetical protein TRAPUB_10982 [Trametes pubescens]